MIASLDVIPLLPTSWQSDVLDVASTLTRQRTLVPTSVTSREADPTLRIPVETVGGRAVKAHLPWLYAVYKVVFRLLAEEHVGVTVYTAEDDRYGINLNVQRGPDNRYECHVDSNPIEGILYVTTHEPGEGGELVVADNDVARGPEEIDRSATRIYPTAGTFVLFDARGRSHYVARLNGDSVRVAAVMNFYTDYCPESARPPDLNWHLFGEP